MPVQNISDKDFDEKVIKSEIPVLVDFWAPWCGPCRIISPLVEELSAEFAGKILFVKINVDENPQQASKFQVFSIPNLKLFSGGKLVDEIVGAAPKQVIKQFLEKSL